MKTDLLGKRVGDYRLVRFLGSGTFGDIYEGVQIYLENHVAVKLLKGPFTDVEIEQFRAEARILARLEHPHIVRILTFSVAMLDEKKLPFLAMDLAPNGALLKRYPRGISLPLTTIVTYVKQIASALQYAHDNKYIHRDVKPENILLGKNDELLLSDFGIAVVVHSTSSLGTPNVGGTLAYMAPEQIKGRPCAASDQYALGIIVYEWLCSTHPFHGTQPEIIAQHLSRRPPPFKRDLCIPISVEEVVMKALKKDPKNRFPTIQAFSDALEAASAPQQNNVPSPLPPKASPNFVLPPISRSNPSSDLASQSHSHSFTPKPPLPPTQSYPPQPRVPTTPRPKRTKVALTLIALIVVLLSSLPLYNIVKASIAYNEATATADVRTATISEATFIAQENKLTATDSAATENAVFAETATAVANAYTPNQGTLELDDYLTGNDSYNWSEATDNNFGGACQFSAEGYYAALESHIQKAFPCIASQTDFDNFVYEVHMRIVIGDCGAIIFRAAMANYNYFEFYFFKVCQNGQYELVKYTFTNSAGVDLIEPQYSSAIHKGLNQDNVIAAVADNTSFDLYVNHQKINSITDGTFSNGQIGVAAEDDNNPTDVAFSYVKVWSLPS